MKFLMENGTIKFIGKISYDDIIGSMAAEGKIATLLRRKSDPCVGTFAQQGNEWTRMAAGKFRPLFDAKLIRFQLGFGIFYFVIEKVGIGLLQVKLTR
jgi:hypothetical protein